MNCTSLFPPECVRGMVELNKNLFNKKITIPVLSVVEDNLMYLIITVLKMYLLKMDHLKPINNHPELNKKKLIYLNPDVVTDFSSFSDSHKESLRNLNITESNLCYHEILLTYDNWKTHEIISAILPSSLSFSGYSIIGTIIHVNLKQNLLPYKYIIGKILLDKNKNCKSVVNKVENIHNNFRNFEMEVLAGTSDLVTEVKENGCRFRFDFSKVFWNSRLHEEHNRIISNINKGDILYDVFCGVGPFVIPAAKNGCEVFANDLNPACYEWLKKNAVLNKIDEHLKMFNKDGHDFIKENIKEDILKRINNQLSSKETIRLHIIMNLPAAAYTFLSDFRELFEEKELSSIIPEHFLPIVHFYCFIKGNVNYKKAAHKLVEENLNISLSDCDVLDIYDVRNVSPFKEMMRVSFRLTNNVLVKKNNEKRKLEIYCNNVKRLKCDSNGAQTDSNFEEMIY